MILQLTLHPPLFVRCGIFLAGFRCWIEWIVLEGFIFNRTASIQCLIVIMQASNDFIVLCSSDLLFALKDLHILWSLANPLSCKSGGITPSNVLQYRLKMLAPVADPCGMLYLRSIAVLKVNLQQHLVVNSIEGRTEIQCHQCHYFLPFKGPRYIIAYF